MMTREELHKIEGETDLTSSQKLTKQGIITEIAAYGGVSRAQAQRALEGLFRSLRENLSEGRKIYFHNIGTLDPQFKEGSTRNSFGTTIDVPSRYKVKFKPTDSFKEELTFSED